MAFNHSSDIDFKDSFKNSKMKNCTVKLYSFLGIDATLYQIETEKQQTEKQVDDFKSLNISNKTDELREIEGIFPKNLWNILNHL